MKGGENMHKKDIIDKLVRKTDLDETSSKRVLNLILGDIAASLKKGQSVTLTGFGTFVIRKKKKRTMRNINDGQFIVVPAHKAVGFEVGLPLKRLVR